MKNALMVFVLLVLGIFSGFFLFSPVVEVETAAGRDPLERLLAVPYVTFSTEADAAGASGVTVHDRARAHPGYNLYCSRTAPAALLLDMEGKLVHRWTYPSRGQTVWDHAVMLEDGDLLVIDKFVDLLRLSRRSELRWSTELQAHHDVAVAEDGSIFALSRVIRRHRDLNVRFTTLAHLTGTGRLIEEWSTADRLDELRQTFETASFLDTVLDGGRSEALEKRSTGQEEDKLYDYFHGNTVTLLPATDLGRRDRRFAEGNLLICLRNVHQIAILERGSWEILWVWGEKVLDEPHHPTMTRNGTILIFDNGFSRGYSKVIEIDPATGRPVWEYQGEPRASFFSARKGSAQRLANGNTLICEGDRGRTFEVTPGGEIVWEWLNPKMEEGHRETVYRMVRLEPEMVAAALERPELLIASHER